MVGGRRLPRRDETQAQHGLFVLTIQKNNLHNNILGLAKQQCHLRELPALGGPQALPKTPNLLETLVRLIEPRKQAFSEFAEFGGAERLRGAQGAVLTFDDQEEFLAESQMLAQGINVGRTEIYRAAIGGVVGRGG